LRSQIGKAWVLLTCSSTIWERVVGDARHGDDHLQQEAREARQIAGDDAKLKIAVACQRQAFHDLGLQPDQLMEVLDLGPGMLLQRDGHQRRDAEAQSLGIEEGAIAADGADLLQALQAPGALRGREGDHLGQGHIGHAAVTLERGQDLAVEIVEIGHAALWHGSGLICSFPALRGDILPWKARIPHGSRAKLAGL